MYATSSPSETYHLVNEDGARTLCGLIVVPIVVDRPVETTALHLTSNPPSNRRLCQQCSQINGDHDE
jgi:hypothetical protein